jgi:hypothetical protein
MPETIYGWVTLAEAETYMGTRLGASKHWNTGADKAAALQTAYNQLVACGLFSFPETAVTAMKNAQCEMALFLLIHQEDIDVRKGLQSQGVTQAGIVQESYDISKASGMPIPPIVSAMLDDYATETNIHVVDLERDESEDAL